MFPAQKTKSIKEKHCGIQSLELEEINTHLRHKNLKTIRSRYIHMTLYIPKFTKCVKKMNFLKFLIFTVYKNVRCSVICL